MAPSAIRTMAGWLMRWLSCGHGSYSATNAGRLFRCPMMRRMAETGCLELRFGIESGSDRVLARIEKGFTSQEAVETVSDAVNVFDRVDSFYVWGFPFETMDDFHQSVFQMISFRMLGSRILPSLLCFLPHSR